MRVTTKTASSGLEIRTQSRLTGAAGAIGVGTALALVFELDRRTGAAQIQHLYYLPIIAASLRLGRAAGLSVAFVAILLYHLANPNLATWRYGQADIVQMALFVAVAAVTTKLADNAHRLRQLAATDDLTGLHNLRSFEARLTSVVRAASRTEAPVALLVLDVDRLKSINDTYGHLAGAEAVRTVGHVLAARLPADAVACRYGGDEFAIAIPNCTADRAQAVAGDLRRAVHATSPVLAGEAFPVRTLSISVGFACVSVSRMRGVNDVETGEALFRAADHALYAAKAQGRNRVSESRSLTKSFRDSPASAARFDR
jgi:diguanylate cyclase (GGDEF)-like protein